MYTNNGLYATHLLESPLAFVPKGFGARSKGLSFVLRKASEQTPATTLSEQVWRGVPMK